MNAYLPDPFPGDSESEPQPTPHWKTLIWFKTLNFIEVNQLDQDKVNLVAEAGLETKELFPSIPIVETIAQQPP